MNNDEIDKLVAIIHAADKLRDAVEVSLLYREEEKALENAVMAYAVARAALNPATEETHQ